MRWFDYLGMAFLLLRVDATLTYWTGVLYIGHLSLPLLYLLGLVAVSQVDQDLRPDSIIENSKMK